MPKLKKRANGYYEITRVDPRTGKRIHFYGKTEREVNRKIMEYTTKGENGRTFRELAEDWREDHYTNIAYTTQRGYEASYLRAIELLGDVCVKDITAQDIKAHLAHMSAQMYSMKTLRTQQLIYSLVLGYAVEQSDIPVNPVAGMKPPKAKKPAEKRQAASEEDEATIKSSVDVWLLPFFLLYTGMRKGEALAIQQKDIDRDTGIIHVTKALYYESYYPRIKEPKTEAGTRTIPLLRPLREALPSGKPNDYIFHSTDAKKPLNKSEFQRRWDAYKRKTGVICTAHQLRHSFATLLFEADIDVKDAQEILGHSSEAMTRDVYTHIRNSRRTKTAEKLDAYLESVV